MDLREVHAGDEYSQFGQSLRLDTDARLVSIYGGFTLVNKQDVILLFQHRWNVSPHRRTAYVIYQGSTISLRLHSIILPVDANHTVDHINGMGWDNRRSNLRASDATGQSRNQRAQSYKQRSKYKGVAYDYNKRLYRARIMVDGKSIGLGRFKSPEDAARAYDSAAKKYFGEFAVVNFQ